jgi:hypothetical protein
MLLNVRQHYDKIYRFYEQWMHRKLTWLQRQWLTRLTIASNTATYRTRQQKAWKPSNSLWLSRALNTLTTGQLADNYWTSTVSASWPIFHDMVGLQVDQPATKKNGHPRTSHDKHDTIRQDCLFSTVGMLSPDCEKVRPSRSDVHEQEGSKFATYISSIW